MSLNSLQGTINAESYISVSEADSLLAADTEWLALDDYIKENALRLATQLIDSLFFYGEKLVSSQALEFPRDYFDYITVTPTSIFQGTSGTITGTANAHDTSISKTLNTVVRQGSVEVTITLLFEGTSTEIVLKDTGSSSNPFYNPIYVASSSLDYNTGALSITFNYEIDDTEEYTISYRYHDTVQYDSFTSSSVSESSIEDYKLYENNAAFVVANGVNAGIGEEVQKLDIFNGLIITDPFSVEIGSDDTLYLIPQLPYNIRIATAKQANYFVGNSTTQDIIKRHAGVIQYKIGDVFASYSSDPVTIKSLFCPDSFFYLNEYIGKKVLGLGRG
ncbi:MAG TPA: hypothetical protein ENL19_01565 [candidate division WOR-3 bacterium]|uniref:Putative DnaT-like domain-containing protein n=1 Tax=candidate division WOR-3 bacterium TaxID=2052148 RepID=A0A7C5HG37_UNCW3|nr:hypothetical protein [candidate division WOR-3 bacterium]